MHIRTYNVLLQLIVVSVLIATICIGCLMPIQAHAFGSGATGPTKPPTTKNDKLHVEERLLIQLVNQVRSSNHLPPLIVDISLSKVAEVKSQDMVSHHYFSHQSPTYGTPFEMMKQFGIKYVTAGENIACNQSVEAAHLALMDSIGHRENILNARFTHIGIGIVNGGQCGKILTQQFIGK